MHPIAFHLGPLTVHWFGIAMATAFLVALLNAARRAPHGGLPGEKISDAAVWLIVGAVLGARTLYVLT